MFVKNISTNLLSFQRRLTPEEKIDYRQNALKPAFDYLGTQDVAMIIHGTCYPEASRDIGVGSPYGKAAAQLIPFEILHGFNSNQLGPVGVIRNTLDVSPYKSTVSTRNYLFLDFTELTTDKYSNILSKDVVNYILNKPSKNGENYAYSDFPEAFANYKYLIRLAYKNYHKSLINREPAAIALRNEFKQYKLQNKNVASNEAVFRILADTYGTDDFTKWKDEDKNLIVSIKANDKSAIERYKKIVDRENEEYDSYLFGQFLLDKQIKENTKLRKELGFKYISDFLVGVSKSDEWANQDIFLKDYEMGCPYGGKFGPQLWKLPVLDPKKLFDSEGNLGPAGIFLKQKLNYALDNFDNVWIENALGLVDPYIYDKNSVVYNDEKLDVSKFKGNNISNLPEIDPDGNFKKVLNEIIIPSLEEHGIDKNYPVWEDLVTETPVFNHIYHNKNHLPGITQLEYMRAENSQDADDWGLIGSHDSSPVNQMIKKDWVRNHDAWNIFYLAGFLNQNPKRSQYRDSFCREIDNNDSLRVKAKFAELFLTCKKIQISFADFFGINKTYNVAGEENDINWKLRLNKDYEDSYYKNLSSENPTALNMPEILKIAVQAKADMDTIKAAHKNGIPDDCISESNDEHVQNILDKLDKYEKILKEPE